MSETLPSDEVARRDTRARFDALAPTYDALAFLPRCARRLAERADLRPGAHVLDVATGTGAAALCAAGIVGPAGRVVGIDLSPAMLERARAKPPMAGAAPVEFREGDATRLEVNGEAYDAVLCASSVFFLPDMAEALRAWRRALVPGGLLGVSTFGSGFLQPLFDLWKARLARHGLAAASLPVHRLPDAEACRRLLAEAGCAHIEVHEEQLGYHLPSAGARWSDILAGIEGVPLASLAPEAREQVRREHLAELTAFMTAKGLWVDVPALLAYGR